MTVISANTNNGATRFSSHTNTSNNKRCAGRRRSYLAACAVLVISVAAWWNTYVFSSSNEMLRSLDMEVAAAYPASNAVIHPASSSQHNGPPPTLVTAYFEIPSKHSSDEYSVWMKNMLSLHDAMVIFTEEKHASTIRSLRQHAIDRTVIITAQLGALPAAKLTSAQLADPTAFWKHQLEIDPESGIHQSYELFWIWLSKTYWVNEAIRANHFASDLFLWVDIGSFREPQYNSKTLVRYPDAVPQDSMLFMAHHKPRPHRIPKDLVWFDKTKHSEHFIHSGSLIAGRAATWRRFLAAFTATVDGYIQRGMFIGEDQTVLQSTCFQNPNLCTYINSKEVRQKDNAYFGIRYVVHHGRPYETWRPGGGQ